MSVVMFADVGAARAAGYRTIADMRAAGHKVMDTGGFGEARGMTAFDENWRVVARTVTVYTDERTYAGRGAWYFMFPPAEVQA